MIPLPPPIVDCQRIPCLRVSGRVDGAGHTGFYDVAGRSPSWYWEQESGTSLQESAEKPEMGMVEKNQLNAQQLSPSQELPKLGQSVPLAHSPHDTPALTPVSEAVSVERSTCSCWHLTDGGDHAQPSPVCTQTSCDFSVQS